MTNGDFQQIHPVGGTSWPTLLGLALLSSLHFVVVFDTLRQKSPTVDEVAHLPAGISYLQQGTFRMYPHNPPLVRVLAASVALLADPKVDYAGTWQNHVPPSHWQFAFEFLKANEQDFDAYRRAFPLARTVIAVWSALTIPILYLWGSWWFGRPAGWLSALLWALSPNIIAHAGMITTDLAATSVGLVASFFFARWLDRPQWSRAIWAGCWLGLAQLTKFSSLWLFLLWPAWAIAEPLWRKPAAGQSRWALFSRRLRPWALVTTSAGRQWIAMTAVAIFVVNAGYLFEGTFTPMGRFPFVSQSLTRERLPGDGAADSSSSRAYNEIYQRRVNRFRGTILERLPCPFPRFYVTGFDEQKFEAEGKYQMYLRGQWAGDDDRNGAGRQGWWSYYLYALAIKVPLSTCLLVALALAGPFLWSRGQRASLAPLILLASAPILAMSLLTDINLGVRYVLPAFPFLFLIAGSMAGADRPRWWNAIAVIAVAWNAAAIARIHPNELAYFNESVGGPSNARFHLIDSNLDWGQDLHGLGRWIEAHPEWKDVRLAYMGTWYPEFEGIEHRLAPRDLRYLSPPERLASERESDPTSYGPQPGKFAVSANFERGMRFHTPCPWTLQAEVQATSPGALLPGSKGQMIWNPRNVYAYFQEFTPQIVPEIGYSILLYDISLEQANEVRQRLGMPLLPDIKE